MTSMEREEYTNKLESRLRVRAAYREKKISTAGIWVRGVIRFVIPEFLLGRLRRAIFPSRALSRTIKCNELVDLLAEFDSKSEFNLS